MSCLEISAASGVLTGRNAAAMMGAARRPGGDDGEWYRQTCRPSTRQCRASRKGRRFARGVMQRRTDYAREQGKTRWRLSLPVRTRTWLRSGLSSSQSKAAMQTESGSPKILDEAERDKTRLLAAWRATVVVWTGVARDRKQNPRSWWLELELQLLSQGNGQEG